MSSAARHRLMSDPFTATPNDLFPLLPHMGEAEMRVALAILRETVGWQRLEVALSSAELQELTGLSHTGVRGGLDALLARGIVTEEAREAGYRVRYRWQPERLAAALAAVESAPRLRVLPPRDDQPRSEAAQLIPQLRNEAAQLAKESSNEAAQLIPQLRNEAAKFDRALKKDDVKKERHTDNDNGVAAVAAARPGTGGGVAVVTDTTTTTAPPTPDAAPPPPPTRRRKRQADPAWREHPAAVAHAELHGYCLNTTQLRALAALDEAAFDAARWGQTLQAWALAGYSPTNVAGLLDWYRDGVPQRRRGRGARASPTEYERAAGQPQLAPAQLEEIARLAEEAKRRKS